MSDHAKPHGDNFSGRVGWGKKPALVVVDLCLAYTDAAGPFALPDIEPVVKANNELIEAMRAKGLPVVFTDVKLDRNLRTAGHFYRKVPAMSIFAEGAHGGWGELTIAPGPNDLVVTKQYASAFFGTTLASTLHAAGVDTVVVAGVSTSGCVRATATDALNYGFRPIVVRQACADRNEEFHSNNLRDLDAKYADVMDLDQARDLIEATHAG
ncbi:MAG: isochorismatase family protein [Hyphomicrobiales bacterium]|nr:MAG: isochorismatase family protein [Hyphomicrobiales bacterium]